LELTDVILSSVHPKRDFFGFPLSAVSLQLSATPFKSKGLPECRSLTADSFIWKSLIP
jgi:hypothetical protein